MISTSGIIGTGLKKCIPMKRDGSVSVAPSAVIEIDEVFEANWAALAAIASQNLEIDSFEETGKKLQDIRLLRVSDVANALEQAYQMGLTVGYNAELG
jgi:hypothetical protein